MINIGKAGKFTLGTRTVKRAGYGARVHFARSGIAVNHAPGASLLETAETAGIVAEHACRSGTCHQCAVTGQWPIRVRRQTRKPLALQGRLGLIERGADKPNALALCATECS